MNSNPERVLIIAYYLQDDTLRIFEMASANSGFPGGNFLSRKKYRRDPKEYEAPMITYKDLGVGKTLEINRFKLNIFACDNDTIELEKVLEY